jgi:hypothetical protein
MSLISDQDKTVPVTVQTRALLCGLATRRRPLASSGANSEGGRSRRTRRMHEARGRCVLRS